MKLRATVLALVLAISYAHAADEPQPNPDVTFHAKPKALPAGAVTENWEPFLGARHDGTSLETHTLKKFPEAGLSIVWEMKRGAGYASPAISGDRLVYIHRIENDEVVECLHPETGARYWQFKYATQYRDRYGYNNGPRCSPVIDGERVYTFGAEGLLHCLNLNTGAVVWKLDVNTDYAVAQNFFGVGATPLIEGELLIVNAGGSEHRGVVALDKLTGKQRWACGDWGASYASPVAADIHGKRRVLVFAGGDSNPPTGGLLCIDPANGAVDFTFPWRSKSYESVNAVQPCVVGDQVFVTASYGAGGALVNITPEMKAEQAWSNGLFGVHFSTVMQRDGFLYGFDGRHTQNAFLTCFEIKSGKNPWRKQLIWQEPVELAGEKRLRQFGVGRGSLLPVEGQYLCLGETGELLRLELSEKGCVEVERSRLFEASETWSPMVLSHGLLYVAQNFRDAHAQTGLRLICYDFRGE